MPIMKRVSRVANNEEGYILIMGLFVMLILILMGIALAVMGIQEFELSARTKMMDQAYLIADSGVNSAAVALENSPTAPSPVYPATDVGMLTETISVGDGKFTYWVYQSEQFPTDANYKVIKSKGTITKQGKTVERIILARIVLGGVSTKYDASFDYLMYNGMSDDHTEIWNPSLGFESTTEGTFGLDGANSYLGHYPLGAIYVDGNIKIPTSRKGKMTIQGRIVATGDAELTSYESANTDNGIIVTGNINVPGNIIAGLGSSGNATVAVTDAAGFASLMKVDGNVCASKNVTATSKTSNNKSDPLGIGGIRAGDTAAVINKKGFTDYEKALNIQTSGITAGTEVDVQTLENMTRVAISGNISANGQTNLAIFSRDISLANSGQHSTISTGNICHSGILTLPPPPVVGISTGSRTIGEEPPVVGVGGDVDLYAEAGLIAPVKLLKPNWAYFELMARQDDVASGPDTVPKGPAHMIYENGPGDKDKTTSGIQFTWNSDVTYNSNEVVYNGDPNVNVYITVDWSQLSPSASFTGTIVSKGSVYITANTIKGGQTLNIVSGLDIQNSTSALVKNADCILHLWAQRNIDFKDINITSLTFYGSFTAGNQIKFTSSSAKWENVNFKWSRWALDPVAWAPPFKVLDWKEI